MQATADPRRIPATTLIFVGLWLFGFILFPVWLVAESRLARLGLYGVLLAYIGLNSWLAYRWLGAYLERPLFAWDKGRVTRFVRQHRGLMALCLLAAALHLYPLTLPLQTGGDEACHVQYATSILKQIEPLTQRLIGLSSPATLRGVLAVAGLGLLGLLWRRELGAQLLWGNPRRRYITVACAAVGGLVFLAGYFCGGGILPLQKHLLRGLAVYPPLGKSLTLLSLLLCGINEFAGRLPILLFSLLAACYMYRLTRLYRDDLTALLAAALLLFQPFFFYYNSLAYLDTGVVFFLLATSFYFLRHSQTRSPRDLVLAAG